MKPFSITVRVGAGLGAAVVLGAAALALVPVAFGGQAGPPQPDALSPYHALLAKECPDKHLEWLSESELDDLIEVNFHDGLSSALRSRWEAADGREKAACADDTGGLSCFNAAYVRAMDDVKLLPRFARMVCESGLVCAGPSECQRP